MRRLLVALLLAAAAPRPCLAQQTEAPRAAAPAAWGGVAVIAMPGATDAAWALARAVYGEARLRPGRMDDASARVLAGEAPPAGATPKLRELAELRAAVRGDDAPSRRLLASLLQETGASVATLVEAPGPSGSRAWVFREGAFEPTALPADPGPGLGWTSALAALKARAPAPPRPAEPARPSLLRSGWFWGAVGAASALGFLVWALRRNDGGTSSNIPLHARFADR